MSDLRTELQAIYDKFGQLTPDLVVQEARAEDHPLHSRVFDRAPEQAAEAWYRYRAHELIQSVRVVYRAPDEQGPERSVRAWHATRRESGYVYDPVEKIAEDPFTRRLLLADMERDWRQLRARYESVQEFFEIVARDLGERAA